MENIVPQLVVLIPWDIQDVGRPEECKYFLFSSKHLDRSFSIDPDRLKSVRSWR